MFVLIPRKCQLPCQDTDRVRFLGRGLKFVIISCSPYILLHLIREQGLYWRDDKSHLMGAWKRDSLVYDF